MPTFEVRLEDGRTLDIDAPNAKAAAQGAASWAKANPNKAPIKPERVTSNQMRNLAAGRNDAPVGKVFDPVGDFVGAMTGSVRNMVENERARWDEQKRRQPQSVGDAILSTPANVARDIADTTGRVADVAGVILSPITGAMDATMIGPASRAMAKYGPTSYAGGDLTVKGGKIGFTPIRPMTEQENVEANRKGFGLALSAAMPGRAGAATGAARVAPATQAAPKVSMTAPRTAPRLAEVVSDAERAGVTPSLAGTGNRGVAATTNAVAENSVAGARVRSAMRRNVDEVAASAGKIASGYGEATSPQMAGEAVQAGVRRFAKSTDTAPPSPSTPARASSFKVKSEAVYDQAFEPIQIAEAQAVEKAGNEFQATRAQAENVAAAENARRKAEYEAAVQARQARIEQAKSVSVDGRVPVEPEIAPPELVTPQDVAPQRPAVIPTQTMSTLKEMSGAVNAPQLSAMITDGRIRSIMGALENDAHNVRFADLRALRTWVRNAQRDPQLRQGIPQAGLQRIEQALTADIYASAERLGGPEALKNLQRADQFYRTGSQRIQNSLQAFDDAGSGEGAYSRILQAAGSTSGADARKLMALKRSLSPDEWGDVAATVIDRMGMPTKGAVDAAEEGAFSLDRFVTGYAGLSPRGRQILFGSAGGGGEKATALASELENLVRVAGRLKATEKAANASKSAVSAQNLGTLGGVTTAPLLTAKVLAGMALTGEIMTNPGAVRWLVKLTEATSRGARTADAMAKRLEAASKTDEAALAVYLAYQKALHPEDRSAAPSPLGGPN